MEPNYTYGEPIPNPMRLELGRIIVDRFMAEGMGFERDNCTEWLKQLGFDQVEWAQPRDDILLLLLWRAGRVEHSYRHGTDVSMIDEFILEFAGHDNLAITLFNFAGERIL